MTRRAGPYSRLDLPTFSGKTREGAFLRGVRAELVNHVGGHPSATQAALIGRGLAFSTFPGASVISRAIRAVMAIAVGINALFDQHRGRSPSACRRRHPWRGPQWQDASPGEPRPAIRALKSSAPQVGTSSFSWNAVQEGGADRAHWDVHSTNTSQQAGGWATISADQYTSYNTYGVPVGHRRP